MQGWIKLHRGLVEWEWYNDINTRMTFIHLLLVANHKDNSWRGVSINRGQRWTSTRSLAKEVCLTEKQIRNALKKLEKTGEISVKGASRGTMITICKYDDYQQEEKQKGKQRASEGQGEGKQGATNKNVKKEKNDKEIINYTEVKDYFNSHNNKLSKVMSITDARKTLIKARISEHSKEAIFTVIDIAEKSEFLNGTNNNQWKASFDWLLNVNNFVKVLEGNYTKEDSKEKVIVAPGYTPPKDMVY